MVHLGKCFCGAVEPEVDGKPEAMGYCHCRCRRSWSADLSTPSASGSLRRSESRWGPSTLGERRQATTLFADLVGFTAFSERSGEEAAYSLMQPISALMTDAIHEEGGTVRSFTGDGIMALFGVPIALEDAPLRACRAALDIQQRISSAAAEIETKYGLRPLMRIGINTGPMIVGEMRSGASTSVTAIGDTVNLASRLQSLAEPGRVLLSEATHRLVQGLVQCGPAGEYEIKGKTERQKAFYLDISPTRGALRRSTEPTAHELCRAQQRTEDPESSP